MFLIDRLLRRTAASLPAPGDTVETILSKIDREVLKRRNLESVLRSLDAAKEALFGCFRTHLEPSTVAKALTLKVLNFCLAKYHFLERSTELISRPFGLVVDTANGCNLACPGCVQSRFAKKFDLFEWKPGMLSEERSSQLMGRYGPYAIQAMFYNYGEPLLSPDTPKFIKQAKSYLMQTTISTNLSVARFNAEAYVQSGLDHIILSIDGATQPVYQRFRQKREYRSGLP